MRISDWRSDVCSSDLERPDRTAAARPVLGRAVPAGAGDGVPPDLARLSPAGVLPALERALRGLRRAVARGNRVDPRRVGGRGRRGGADDQRAAARAPGPAPAGEYDHANRLVARARALGRSGRARSEENTSALQSLMRISYAVFCLKQQ